MEFTLSRSVNCSHARSHLILPRGYFGIAAVCGGLLAFVAILDQRGITSSLLPNLIYLRPENESTLLVASHVFVQGWPSDNYAAFDNEVEVVLTYEDVVLEVALGR